MFSWMGSDVISGIELVVVEGFSINGFTFWETLFELLNTSNGSNNTGDGILRVLLFISSDELLDSHIEHEESFIFITDALKKGKEIEFSSVSFKETLLDLSKFDLVIRVSELCQ